MTNPLGLSTALSHLFNLLDLSPNPLQFHAPSMPYFVANNPTANRLAEMILPPQALPPFVGRPNS